MCEIDTDSYSDVWVEKERIARKQHRCDCCNGLIHKANKYTKHFSIFEGCVSSEKLCAACHFDRGEFSKMHEHWTPSPSATKELIQECLHSREDFKRMLKWARILRGMRQRKLDSLGGRG